MDLVSGLERAIAKREGRGYVVMKNLVPGSTVQLINSSGEVHFDFFHKSENIALSFGGKFDCHTNLSREQREYMKGVKGSENAKLLDKADLGAFEIAKYILVDAAHVSIDLSTQLRETSWMENQLSFFGVFSEMYKSYYAFVEKISFGKHGKRNFVRVAQMSDSALAWSVFSLGTQALYNSVSDSTSAVVGDTSGKELFRKKMKMLNDVQVQSGRAASRFYQMAVSEAENYTRRFGGSRAQNEVDAFVRLYERVKKDLEIQSSQVFI